VRYRVLKCSNPAGASLYDMDGNSLAGDVMLLGLPNEFDLDALNGGGNGMNGVTKEVHEALREECSRLKGRDEALTSENEKLWARNKELEDKLADHADMLLKDKLKAVG
jgi:hypothetical protein